jgi:hypothetical protein
MVSVGSPAQAMLSNRPRRVPLTSQAPDLELWSFRSRSGDDASSIAHHASGTVERRTTATQRRGDAGGNGNARRGAPRLWSRALRGDHDSRRPSGRLGTAVATRHDPGFAWSGRAGVLRLREQAPRRDTGPPWARIARTQQGIAWQYGRQEVCVAGLVEGGSDVEPCRPKGLGRSFAGRREAASASARKGRPTPRRRDIGTGSPGDGSADEHGKPRRASSASRRQRRDATTDSRSEQRLEVERTTVRNGEEARRRGDAPEAELEGNTLEGRASTRSEASVADQRRAVHETRRTPGSAEGCNKPSAVSEAETVKVVRNHEGGTCRVVAPLGRSERKRAGGRDEVRHDGGGDRRKDGGRSRPNAAFVRCDSDCGS